jgi:ribose transport system permease protein
MTTLKRPGVAPAAPATRDGERTDMTDSVGVDEREKASAAQATTMEHKLPPFARRGAQWALPVILVALIVIFSLARSDVFFTSGNLTTVLAGQSTLILVALGAMLPLVVGQFDLSVGANMATAAVLLALLSGDYQWPAFAAIGAALGASTLIGLLNGVLVARVGVDSFVVTLAVSSVLAGALVWSTNGTVVYEGIPEGLTEFGQREVAALPLTFICVLLTALAILYVLRMTPTGRYLYAIGGSREAARLTGINVSRLTIGSFVAGGLLCGLGGVFLVAKVGSVNPTTGPEFLLPAFAACFLGATSVRPGVFNVVGTVLAVLVIAVGTTGLQMFGAPFYIQPIFAGLILLLASLATRYLKGAQRA